MTAKGKLIFQSKILCEFNATLLKQVTDRSMWIHKTANALIRNRVDYWNSVINFHLCQWTTKCLHKSVHLYHLKTNLVYLPRGILWPISLKDLFAVMLGKDFLFNQAFLNGNQSLFVVFLKTDLILQSYGKGIILECLKR